MQTRLSAAFLDTTAGREADGILRKCVHCGFCTATCPTYQLLGDELDGPRGRIYLIKEMLEGAEPSRTTQLHLDRCLTCRACETTCPSGVRYGRLLDIGRHHMEQVVPRTLRERLFRRALLTVVPYRKRFGALLGLARAFRGLMPVALRRAVPAASPAGAWPAARHQRRMLVLSGCAQPAAAPGINAAAARVLDRLGISLLAVNDGCCGALAHHLSEEDRARQQMRRNIDAWWPEIERGAEAVVVTASGCGAMICEYGVLLRDDPEYARKAERVSQLFRDVSQVVAQELARPERAVGTAGACRASASGVPFALHAATRFEAPRHRRAAARAGRIHADCRCRWPPLLRIGRQLLPAAAGNLAPAKSQQAGGPAGGRARHHCDGKHRLPVASRLGNRAPGPALDRGAGSGSAGIYCVIIMTELVLSSLQ